MKFTHNISTPLTSVHSSKSEQKIESHKTQNVFSEHLFEYRSVEKRKLILSLTITAIVMVIEFIGGIFTNSIALMSDAGHMFTHCFAIGIGLIAIIIARNPPCHHRTFGLYRTEVLAAFVNGLFLLLVAGIIIYEAVIRIIHPKEILTYQMLIIALLGLIVNLASIIILHGSHKKNINIRSVFYHMIADAASSIGIVIAAVIIFYTGLNILDPLISLGISSLIIAWAWRIIKETTKILLEMAPTGLNIDSINNDLMKNFPEIKEICNTHLWTITTDLLVFSAHIKLHDTALDQKKIISNINKYLSDNYHIIESTIQII